MGPGRLARLGQVHHSTMLPIEGCPRQLPCNRVRGYRINKTGREDLSRHIRARNASFPRLCSFIHGWILELVRTAAAACPTMSKHPPASRLVVVAAAALMCSTLAQQLVTRNIELSSEIFAWAVLPVLLVLLRWPGLKNELCTKVLNHPNQGRTSEDRHPLYCGSGGCFLVPP